MYDKTDPIILNNNDERNEWLVGQMDGGYDDEYLVVDDDSLT